MKQKLFIIKLILLTGIMAAAGCSQPAVKERPVPELPQETTVRLYIPRQLDIVSLDGKKGQRPSVSSDNSFYIDLLPGRHTLTVAAAEGAGTKTLAFSARLGNSYRLSYKEYDKQVVNKGNTYAIAFKWKVRVNVILSPRVSRGLKFSRKGEYDRAIYEFSKAIELNAFDLYAYKHRGTAYLKKGNPELAVSDFTKGIKLAPEYSWFYLNRAEAYFQMGEPAKACADLKQACELGNCRAYNARKDDKICKR